MSCKFVVWVATTCTQVQKLVYVVVIGRPTTAPIGGEKPIDSVLIILKEFCV